MTTLYRQLADHYLEAIHAGTLSVGERFPSVRALMRTHDVSLSTALQACRHLEDQGWLQARPRSGYYVRKPRRAQLPPTSEFSDATLADPAAWVGIHARLSAILARGQQHPVRVNLSLAVGAPQLYPTEALTRITQRSLRQHPDILTTMSRRHGHPALRTTLARRALERGISVAPEEVIVTHGCIESLNLALRAITQPGDTVAVESPTFYGLLQVLESLGLRALEIPTSPRTGISLDALGFALQQGGHEGRGIRAVALIPTLQNPLGSVMPDAHKEQLVQLCARHEVPVIEDDIYADMGQADTPYRALKSWDHDGNVIYCNSLNKMLAPGMRLGWILAGRWQARVEMLKYAQSRYSEELAQIVAAEFMASAAHDRHLHQLRQSLKRQREQMAEAVASHFPAGTRLSVPEGGMLLWVEMPAQVSGEAVFDAALPEGIKVAPGSMFSNSRRFDNYLRLSCGWPFGPEVDQALRTVGAIVGRMAQA